MDDRLRKLQNVLLGIMDVIDDFCKKNNITYSLYGGTLLGAIRHKGFIPWDDDIDIIMDRSDYTKFIFLWQKEHPSGYFLHTKDIDIHYSEVFAKIHKDRTTFISYEWEKQRIHKGIYVDVFVLDRIPTKVFPKWLYYFRAFKYISLVKESPVTTNNIFAKIVITYYSQLYSISQRSKMRKKLLSKLTKYDKIEDYPRIECCCYLGMKFVLPCNILDSVINTEFEGRNYYISTQYDKWLRIIYGDYMKLPPISEQTYKHKPLELDFLNGDYEIENV